MLENQRVSKKDEMIDVGQSCGTCRNLIQQTATFVSIFTEYDHERSNLASVLLVRFCGFSVSLLWMLNKGKKLQQIFSNHRLCSPKVPEGD
jgi:hypothetical protein